MQPEDWWAKTDYFWQWRKIRLIANEAIQFAAAYTYIFVILYVCNDVIAVNDVPDLQRHIQADYNQLENCLANKK